MTNLNLNFTKVHLQQLINIPITDKINKKNYQRTMN